MLTDSHCHLHMLELADFNGNIEGIIQIAEENRVEYMLCVGTRLEDVPEILNIANRHVGISASVGLHPNELTDNEPTAEEIVQLASHPKVIAIGETGLDYYRTEEQQPWQIARFRTHIQAAKLCKKPLVIHTRSARADTLAILREEKADKIGGVFHCFTEDWETAKAGLDLGFYISFSGIVTFKNAVEIQEVAKKVPMDRLLIETDCPYLTPIPHRGKMNQPAYVRYIAECIAVLRGESFEKIAQKTTDNYLKLFNLVATAI
jgi:TatD DNase family protein